MSVRVCRAADRFVTRRDGIVSRHSFSFGGHYDPANTAFGPLVACNEELLAAGAGFPDHPHRGLEIVTWVLQGALAHRDSTGTQATVLPGTVQWLRTGTGIVHSEMNAAEQPTSFVQLWLVSDEPSRPPSYELHDAGEALAEGGLAPVLAVGGRAVLHVARLEPGQQVVLPEGGLTHLLVGRGTVDLADEVLATGDTARLTGADPRRLRAQAPAEVVVLSVEQE